MTSANAHQNVVSVANNTEKISISRDENVKKPFLENDTAIFYTPKSLTLKPRSSKEVNMGVILNYSDYLIPERDLLPSFKTHLTLILPEEELKGSRLKIILMNRSFNNTYRITKNTGLISLIILNRSVNLHFTNKYIT